VEVDAVAVVSPSRPDLLAYRESTTTAFPKLVRTLAGIIGKKLTAYVAGVKDVRALDRWMDGAEPYKGAEERLRFTFRIVRTLQTSDHPDVVQAWLTGLNPELNDRVPVRLLREGDLEKVAPDILGAARAFLAGA
jgi:hypothetical protein